MLLLASSVRFVPHVFLIFFDIGHYILFDKGILHRDVSTGNILRCSKPIMRPALDK